MVRMENERVTKKMVSGCYEGSKGKMKKKKMKQKTVLYWKKILREPGVDWTDVEQFCVERNRCKQCVR